MLLLCVPVPGAQAVFPGQNGRIAFDRGGDIWVMDPDGSNQIRLTTSPASEQEPAWSADGTKIAFARDDGDLEIWVMDADGTHPQRLTRNGVDDTDPAWSPDGSELVFTRGFEIWRIDADGTHQRSIGSGGDASWSPDGTRLVATDGLITLMDPDGSNRVPLVPDDGATNDRPAWSPDGLQVVFRRNEIGRHDDLAVVNADGSDLHRVTDLLDGDFIGESAWSPDGTSVAFELNHQIQLADPTTGIVTPLSAAGEHPDWQALAAAGRCTLTGTPGDDVLHGTSANDVICGGGGDDVVDGRGGNDRVMGGTGDDLVIGGPGRDVLFGGPGADDLWGGHGSDRLDTRADGAIDRVHGGSGQDVCLTDPDDVVAGCP
jgi:Tol biopolymer transport system component